MIDQVDKVPPIQSRLSRLCTDLVTGKVNPDKIQSAVHIEAILRGILEEKRAAVAVGLNETLRSKGIL